MRRIVFSFIITSALLSCSSNSKKEELPDYSKYKIATLGKYVYIDQGKVIHTQKDCKSVFKKNNTQSIDVVPSRYIWAPQFVLQNICSKCVTSRQIEQLDSIISSIAYYDRRWLFGRLSEEYEVKDWRTFNSYLDDEDNRKTLYNNIKKDFDLGTYEEFEKTILDYERQFNEPKKSKL